MYMSRIADLYAQDFVDQLPKDVKFDTAKAFKLQVTLKDNKVKTIEISGNYAKVSGMQGYVKLSEYAANSLKKGLNEFRDKHVWNAPRETIRRVAITTKKGGFVLKRDGNVWKFEKPKGLKLDDSKRERLLKDIETLTATDFEKPTPQALRKAKFANPWVKCRITLNDGHEMELVIGGLKKGGQRYARVTGQKDLLLISTYMAEKLHKTAKDLEKKVDKKAAKK